MYICACIYVYTHTHIYIFLDKVFKSYLHTKARPPPTSLLFLVKSHPTFRVSCIQVKYALLKTIVVY